LSVLSGSKQESAKTYSRGAHFIAIKTCATVAPTGLV
jgi:hypothetical protein